MFKYEIPDYAVGGKEAMLFKPIVMNNLYRNQQSFLRVGDNSASRKYAFRDGCSRMVNFTETITLPEGYKMQTPPMKSQISNDVASIDASLSQTDNKITLLLNAAFNKRIYEASEWPMFKEVVDSYKKFQNYIYIK